MAATNDKLLIEDIQQTFADVNNILHLDDQDLVNIEDADLKCILCCMLLSKLPI